VERKNSLLTGRNLKQNRTQEGRSSASTGWGLTRQKRGGNKHHPTRPVIPAVREKHRMMTTIMSYVHAE